MNNEASPPLILRILYGLEDGLLVAALSLMILLSFGQIVLRNLAHTGLVWGDPFLRHLVLWLGLLGAMVATREDNHININVISRFLSGRAKAIVRILTDTFTAGVCALLTYASILFLRYEIEAGTTVFEKVPAWIAELILPIAFGVITLHYLVYLGIHIIEACKETPDEKEVTGGKG